MAKCATKGASLRILIVRFSAIGDCVMAGYAVNDLRHAYPDAEITWVVEDRCSGIISDTKLVHRRLDLPRSQWRPKGELRTLLEQYRWLTGLRKYKFDYGFDLQGHSKTAWCLRLSGAQRRLAHPSTDALAKHLNPQFRAEGFDQMHSVERSRTLVGSLLPSPPTSNDFLPGGAETINPKLVTICVGAGHPRKLIPPATLQSVGQTLARQGYSVVYLGGSKDTIDHPEGTTNLVGQTTIEESVAWIRQSAVHIAGDTGTGHIAAQVGTPLVTIWGNMPLARFRPYTNRLTLIDHDGDPQRATTDEIVSAALRWIA